MKRLEVILVLFFLVLFLGHTASFACGDSLANAGASANANAASFASGGSSHVSNLNAPQTKIGVQVDSDINPEIKVNSGQTVAPKTTSSVTIDSHARYIQVNRHFLPLPISGNMGGAMQDFLPPEVFGFPWNYSGVLEGIWRQKREIKKIKIKEIKEHCYRKLRPQKEVRLITNHKVLIRGSIVGEIMIKAESTEDSRAVQMAAIDKLASWGANIIEFTVNALEHEAKSSYSGFILGSGVGGLMASQEKIAASGSGGIGKGSSKLSFLHYPVVHAVGYRGKILKVEKKKAKKEELEVETDGKKWQAIQP